MNKTIIAVVVILLVAAGMYALLRTDAGTTNEPSVVRSATYSSSELGIAFDYAAGPDGYVIQKVASQDPNEAWLATLVVMATKDVDNMPEGGEGPPTITIHVMRNAQKQQPQAWAEMHPQYSNINLKIDDVEEAVVGGANAIRYMADGLYASDNTVVAHGDNVYVISGMFIDRDSDIRRDYQPLLDSVRFIPAPGQE